MKSDIEIAQEATLLLVTGVAAGLGLEIDAIDLVDGEIVGLF